MGIESGLVPRSGSASDPESGWGSGLRTRSGSMVVGAVKVWSPGLGQILVLRSGLVSGHDQSYDRVESWVRVLGEGFILWLALGASIGLRFGVRFQVKVGVRILGRDRDRDWESRSGYRDRVDSRVLDLVLARGRVRVKVMSWVGVGSWEFGVGS